MRKYITMILILSFGMGFSQTNVVQEGYYEIMDSSGNVFDSKSSEKETLQAIYNYFINTGEKATYRSPTVRVDFDDDIFTQKAGDTVYVGTDEIILLDAIMYDNDTIEVSDITLFYDIEVDTVTVTPCFEDFDNPKSWFHVGDVDSYPHRIWFPTKEFEFIGLMFSDSLTTEQKATKTEFIIERTKNRMSGNTSYKYLPSLQE